MAMQNFLKFISDKDAAIFITNAGVNGIASNRTKFDNFILSIFSINVSNLSIFLSFFLTKLFNNVRHKKNENKHPKQVKI